MSGTPVDQVLRSFRAGLRPPALISVSEWADRNRVLSQRASAEPGRWRTSRTPYLREIMDALSITSAVQRVVVMAAAQVGKTECGNNWIGYVIDVAPGPMLSVSPTVEMAQKNSRTRIDTLIQESPVLLSKVAAPRAKDAGNTVLQKLFPGGVLALTGANSPVGLRSMPAKYIFLDEVDAYPEDCGGEGDPVALAEARSRSFHNRKLLATSTPTIEGRSRIADLYEESDQRVYLVPCPECGHEQPLKWEFVIYEKDDPETTRYACAGCGVLLEETAKAHMLSRGRWHARNPGHRVRGYHLSALYSPWFTWRECVEHFLGAKDNPDQLRAWVNTVLGETWREKGEAPVWQALYRRREPYPIGTVPRGPCVLTAGVDVQADRIEIEIVGWAPRLESWSIDHIVLPGDTSGETPWTALDELLARAWPRPSGGELRLAMVAVDSGYHTQHVYNWVRKHDVSRVMAIKGGESTSQIVSQPSRVDFSWQGKKIARGVTLWTVGGPMAKGELYGWLRRDPPIDPAEPLPVGWVHFPEYGEEWFRQLCAEQVVIRKVKGRRRAEWQKLRERNEVLDCWVYARAAAHVLGVDRWSEEQWTALAAALEPKKEPKAPRRREGYLDRWRGPKNN